MSKPLPKDWSLNLRTNIDRVFDVFMYAFPSTPPRKDLPMVQRLLEVPLVHRDRAYHNLARSLTHLYFDELTAGLWCEDMFGYIWVSLSDIPSLLTGCPISPTAVCEAGCLAFASARLSPAEMTELLLRSWSREVPEHRDPYDYQLSRLKLTWFRDQGMIDSDLS